MSEPIARLEATGRSWLLEIDAKAQPAHRYWVANHSAESLPLAGRDWAEPLASAYGSTPDEAITNAFADLEAKR
jgi:hypothetical protein